jgi:hypothetical protein
LVPRYVAERAHRKIRETVTPQDPIRRKVLRPYLSTKKNVQMLPTMVKVVQQALRSNGLKPVKPRPA